jgi:hypothetical protein
MWPRVAERVLGGWAPTLRMSALLLVTLAVGLAGVLAAWGTIGVACAVLLCELMRRVMASVQRPLSI